MRKSRQEYPEIPFIIEGKDIRFVGEKRERGIGIKASRIKGRQS